MKNEAERRARTQAQPRCLFCSGPVHPMEQCPVFKSMIGGVGWSFDFEGGTKASGSPFGGFSSNPFGFGGGNPFGQQARQKTPPRPPQPPTPSWRSALGYGEHERPTLSEAKARYREKISQSHPDKEGGDHDRAVALNRAWEQARRELGGR